MHTTVVLSSLDIFEFLISFNFGAKSLSAWSANFVSFLCTFFLTLHKVWSYDEEIDIIWKKGRKRVWIRYVKGHTISKANYGVLNSPQKRTLGWFQYIKLSQRSFLGRIEDNLNCFRDLLTFKTLTLVKAAFFTGYYWAPHTSKLWR